MTKWSPERLQRVHRQRQVKFNVKPLGNIVDHILGRLVLPKQADIEILRQAWQELLPEELQLHSHLESLRRGQLRVLVDNGASLYELNLMVDEGLLDLICQACPKVKV
ncbi:MAG: DUF721 domain-containing protein, partial [Planctomycetes bacterium]|nr:DUF721 domain-containing protein [Planctomycetota bacterium]